MGLSATFYKVSGTETYSNLETISINKDGSCTMIAERTAPSGEGNGSQILRFPATPYAVTITKT